MNMNSSHVFPWTFSELSGAEVSAFDPGHEPEGEEGLFKT